MLKQITRYLKGTLHHGLSYEPRDTVLRTQSDADFAGYLDTRQSTYGGLIYIGPCLVSWCSRKIKSVITKTFAAEYISASNVAMHIKWIRQLLQELQPTTNQALLQATPLQMDNNSAIACTKKHAPTKKSKYIDVRYHHIQDLVAAKVIETSYTKTTELQADLLTNRLGPQTFLECRPKLRVNDPPVIPTAVEVS